MNVDGVITEVRSITRDESFDDLWMVERINMGLKEIAAVMLIPGLSASDTVTALTTANHVSMPADFLHSLYLATTETYPGGLVLSPNSKDLITRTDPEETGNVRMVAEEAKTLYYNPVPSEADEAITLYYYNNPDELTLASDLPSWIPSHLQKSLVLNYLTKEIFNLIEEGIDGQMPNAAKYSQLYGQALMLLGAFYPKVSKPYYKVTSTPVWY